MSAAMIALVAGIAVASGPEPILGEMKQTLDLRGYWEGTWKRILPGGRPDNYKARLKPGVLQAILEGDWRGWTADAPCRFVVEGPGKCRLCYFNTVYTSRGQD